MSKKKLDIFDKLMQLPSLRIFEPFYKKNKEILLYLFFGGITVFFNMGLFTLIDYKTNINELVNNIICWVLCVLFQFFTNRTWVFETSIKTSEDFIKQLFSFFGGRFFTLFLEEIILIVFISYLMFNTIIVKLIAQVVVIISNYVISKIWVFKKEKY